MTTPPKRGPGRPPKDPAGPQQVCRVRLTPTERQHLERKYGSVNAGLQELVRRDLPNTR